MGDKTSSQQGFAVDQSCDDLFQAGWGWSSSAVRLLDHLRRAFLPLCTTGKSASVTGKTGPAAFWFLRCVTAQPGLTRLRVARDNESSTVAAE